MILRAPKECLWHDAPFIFFINARQMSRSLPKACRWVAFLYFLFAIQQNGSAQQNKTVSVMDFVKIRNGKKAEALYYYENNWKVYRELAVEKGLIHSYQLVMAAPDSLNNFDLILITTYRDSAQYLKSEENFQPILKELRPNGPKLLNELKPADFRQNVFVKITTPVFSSALKPKTDD